jgi:hypothetical protein
MKIPIPSPLVPLVSLVVQAFLTTKGTASIGMRGHKVDAITDSLWRLSLVPTWNMGTSNAPTQSMGASNGDEEEM